MQKLKLLALVSVIALSTLFETPSHTTAQDKPTKLPTLLAQCSIIDELDEHIQQRFLEADKKFGYARVAPRSHIYSAPKPRFFPRDEEYLTINDLEKGGWQVGFYLAGCGVLGEKPADDRWQVKNIYQPLPPIKGALPITKNVDVDALPEAKALWEQAKTALVTLAKQDRYDFGYGKWTFSARPIRAQVECLQCHINEQSTRGIPPGMLVDENDKPVAVPASTFKVGDVLGVAIYAYRLAK